MRRLSEISKEEILKLRKIIEEEKISAIVEGKRDKKSLEFFNFEKIFTINGKSLIDFVEEIDRKKIVILTDFDREGRNKAREIFRLLKMKNFQIENGLRLKFRKIFGIEKIEELENLIKKIMKIQI